MNIPDGIPVPEDASLKETITKTAAYAKQNGPSFVEKLKNDDRFSFTDPDNEYYEYFQHILSYDTDKSLLPREPYPFSFTSYDKNLSPRDLEIIKAAAAFCVANEDLNYLDKMRQQFGSNPQFGFLNPDHSLNETFIHFMNQYKQVKKNTLDPPAFDYLNEDYKSVILRRSFQRAEYREYAKELENEKKQVSRLQKIQFSAYDWTNFKVVHTLTLSNTSNEPLNFAELSLRRINKTSEIPLFSGKEFSTNTETTKNRKRKVKAAGETRIKRRRADENSRDIQCPITHKMIPEDKFDRHLQILLGDPHYKTEREKYKAKHRLTNLSSDEVFENIKNIARNTTGL
ncbi:hypothetical protein ZYGR_0I07630 [Zygosaccharomyces rouxii]|uniref:ZYRO0C18062p n=2 Tax=Zygosaccharomyces rouxii TaxID=4956 RepID=C5DUM7_ZYGRC|nr:uncharacterized protein ZYRO0C18062g [Zygosaccharomyces rouxii]KAH9201341.1 Pre-mRNA-splicing factor PRP21 [Zygosaccharomyces rouxii]GAV48466.1 hypothetical protein ZYGR_0I07630 [Zygosaccharomyces rouxii]CAQ43558.1 Pre-mRNA-splicing factor PRP21 [Zygosaccharomyces rouxii]CAR27488.1 ZYRO0C18062p [Zygosaccharomyces rouxii]